MELRLDFIRQEAHIVIGRPDYLQQVWILQTGGINTDKEEVDRTNSSNGRLPASSPDPLRILTR
jgi:hypothetical protein